MGATSLLRLILASTFLLTLSSGCGELESGRRNRAKPVVTRSAASVRSSGCLQLDQPNVTPTEIVYGNISLEDTLEFFACPHPQDPNKLHVEHLSLNSNTYCIFPVKELGNSFVLPSNGFFSCYRMTSEGVDIDVTDVNYDSVVIAPQEFGQAMLNFLAAPQYYDEPEIYSWGRVKN